MRREVVSGGGWDCTPAFARLSDSSRLLATLYVSSQDVSSGTAKARDASANLENKLESKFNPLGGLRTEREITIEDSRGLRRLIVPRGTLVIAQYDAEKIEGTSILVDAYIRLDAVFCGMRLEADDIEPFV